MADVDAIYTDRNGLAQLAGKLAQELGMDVRWGDDPEAPDWPVLFIQLPTGQISWHIPRYEASFAAPTGGEWDGHTNAEKAARIALYVAQPPPPRNVICGVISYSGAYGEPIACGYAPHHGGHHSWSTLPTFVEGAIPCQSCGKAIPLPTLCHRCAALQG